MKNFSFSALVGLLLLFVSQGTWAQTTIDFNGVDGGGYALSYSEGGFSFSINDPGNDRIISSQLNGGFGNSKCLWDNNDGVSGFITKWTIKKTSGDPAFKFMGIYLKDAELGGSTSGTITAINTLGNPIGTPVTVNFDGNYTSLFNTFAGNTDFEDVAEIWIEAPDINFYLDHFTYGPPGPVGANDPAEVLGISLVGTPASAATTVSYNVTFTKAATNVDVADFILTKAGSANGTIASVTGSGTTYTAVINGISGEGSIRLDLKAGTDIKNSAGNGGTAAFTGGQPHYVTACFMETFDQDETNGVKSFSGNGETFTMTGNWSVNTESPNNGLGGSAFNLKATSPGLFALKPTIGEITVKGLYLYLSSDPDGLAPTGVGSVIIKGFRDGNPVPVYTFTKTGGFETNSASNSGYTYIDFSAESGDHSAKVIDELQISIGGGFLYMNLDNFSWCEGFVPPAITSSTYDAFTGELVVTGTDLVSMTGANNDIIANKFTFTGEGGAIHTLTNTSNAEIISGTSFTLTLSATDRAMVNTIMNKNGISSSSGTTYNLAAAEDWAAGADVTRVIADLTGNGITISNVATPAITSASYNAATGTLAVTGTGFLSKAGANNDIEANKLTLKGEGGTIHTLTDTQNKEISSGTSFTLVLSATDRATVNAMMNKDGTSSTDGTTYNLAADEDWAAGAAVGVVIVDLTGNGITVSNVAVPVITAASYDAATGTLAVTGTGFLSSAGASNDIVANKFTLKGEGGLTYTLTDTQDKEISSGTSFTLALSATDKAAVNVMMNRNGTSSTDGTAYNLAADENWAAGADVSVTTADMTGNGITLSNVAAPSITSATYDAATGTLTVTGTGFLRSAGANNDIVANKFTLTGEGGATYTLSDTENGEISSGTSFTLVLSITDRAAVNVMMNKNGTSSTSGTTYNLAAAEDWAAGADAATVVGDTTGNGITVSNVAAPVITSATYDAATGTLTVTGTGFLSKAGANNDIVASKLTLTGEGGATYTLTDTQDKEISSGTSFTLVMSATDRAGGNALMNKNGTSSTDGTTYNLAADEDWAAGAAVGVVVADMTGNGITVSNVNYAPTDIAIDNSSVNQSAGANAVVGTLSSTDANAGNTFTYTLATGTGSTNNADFNISGTSLRANNASSMPAGTYSVRIQTSDQDGAAFQKVFNNLNVVDDIEPTVTVSSDKANLKIGETAAVTFTLSEASTNFAETDVTVSGGTLSGFSGSGTTYTAIFTPTTNTTTTATIDVVTGTFTDAAGNDNSAASQQTIVVDTEAPTVTISSDKTSLKVGETAALTFTLSEASADFVLADVTVANGTLSGFSGSGASYTATFTPPVITTATATINIGVDVFTDAAGNNNTAATQLSIAVDTETPRVDISSDKTSLNATETATLTFMVSEALTNFSISDISVTGGTLSDFTGSGAAWSATFTPLANTVTTATIDVNAGTFNDVAGNSNTAATQVTIAVDTEVPSGYSITIDQIEIDLANQTALSFTFSGAELTTTFKYSISSDGGGTAITGSGTVTSANQQVAGINVSTLPNGALTVSTTLTDGAGNVGNPATDNVTKAVNYPPVVNASIGITTFTESADGIIVPVAIDPGLTVTDMDNTTLASATVRIEPAGFQSGEDILAFVNDGSMGNIGASYDAGTGVLTLTSAGPSATLLEWQAALRAITYSNSSHDPSTANRTISFVANDALDDGAAATKIVSVQAVNNAPVVTNVDGDAVSFTEGGTPVLIDASGNAAVSDPDSDDFDGGNLSIASISNEVAGEDVLGIRDEGMGAGMIALVVDEVHYGGIQIGVFTGGTSGLDLAVVFNSAATPAAVQALIRSLTYFNNNTTNPALAPRTISITLNDGDGGTSAVSEVTVNITAVNDVPTVTTSGGAVTFTEPTDGAPVPVVVDATLTVGDPDNTALAFATISITGNHQSDQDILTFVNDGSTMDNIAGSYNASTGVLTLTSAGASATLAEWDAALQAVTYSNSSQDPNTTTRTVTFVVNDGLDSSTSGTKDIDLVAVNTAPIAVDDAVTVNEDATATGNVLANDSDPEGNALTVYLVTPTKKGLVVLNSDGSFTYFPEDDYAGLDSLKYQVCDNGTPSLCRTAWLRFTIAPVNDAPVITAPAGLTLNEDVQTPLMGISFSDVDAGSANVTVTFSVVSGTLAAISGGGITVSGSETGSLTMVGSIADINAFIAAGSLTFTTALNATADVTLTIDIDDGGNTGTDPGNSGTGTSEAASTTVTLDVTAINDAPVNTIPVDQMVDQDGVLVFSTGNGNTISVSDIDAGAGTIQVTLTATNGLVTLGRTTGLTFTSGTGTSDAMMTFQGTLVDINNVFEGMTFTPTSVYNGTASLQILTNDLGSTGAGGNQTDTDVIGITVNPTNPEVVAVGSTTTDGLYKVGDVISLTLTFDQTVTVDETGGSATLLLETGSTDQVADYVSGSGTSTLTFEYIVQAGDVSADLDYQSIAALTLNGATIQSTSGDDAILTLPALGGANSIAGQHALVIDGVAPIVTSVAVPADGYYREGQVLTFTVQLNDNVTVNTGSGTPYLGLTIGTTAVQAMYTGGSGGNALTFSYTVQATDQDLDGIAVEGTIDPNGGTIQDNAGNDALLVLNGLTPTDQVFVYSVKPSVTLATEVTSPVNVPFTVTVTFSEPVTGFLLSDVTTTNATLAGLVPINNTTYTMLAIPQSDGLVSLQVPAGIAANIGNNGNTASDALTLTFDGTAPAVPTGLSPTAGDTEIGLEWTANVESDVVSYRVYGGTTANPTTLLATVPAGTLSYLHAGLTNGTMYYYRILAIDIAGNESVRSLQVTEVPMADQAITFNALGAVVYGDGPLTLTAAASSGLPVSYTSSNPAIASITGNTVTIHAVGTVTILAQQEGDEAFHAAADVAQTLTINKATLAVTAEAKTKVYDTADPSLTYTYSGLVAGDTESVFTGALLRDAGEEVATYAITQGTLAAGGNYTITFTEADFVITRATITGITLEDGSFVFDGAAKMLAITGNLPDGTSVNYTGNSRTDVGTQEVTAKITGGDYEPLVLTADLTITSATITGITLEDGSFVFDGAAKSLVIAGTLPDSTSVSYIDNSRTDVGTQEATATIIGNNYLTLVLTADLTVTSATITGITLEDGSFVFDGAAKSLTIAGTLPDGTSVSYIDNSRTDVGTQEATAIISGGNYQDLVLTADLTITAGTRSIDFPEISAKTYGDADFTAGATASSGEVVGYTSSNTAVAAVSAAGKVTIKGAGTATITATVPENSNYANRPSLSRTLVVAKANQQITFAEVGAVDRDAGSIPLEVSSSSGLEVSLVVDDAQVATVSGKTLDILRLGTVRVTATQAGDGNYNAAAPVIVEVRVVDADDKLSIRVHPALSPNGDGINDFMMVEGIKEYPENRLIIMNRNGNKVTEIIGYNNTDRVFRGIGPGNEQLSSGTYYYLLEVKVDGVWKYRKGYFVIRY